MLMQSEELVHRFRSGAADGTRPDLDDIADAKVLPTCAHIAAIPQHRD